MKNIQTYEGFTPGISDILNYYKGRVGKFKNFITGKKEVKKYPFAIEDIENIVEETLTDLSDIGIDVSIRRDRTGGGDDFEYLVISIRGTMRCSDVLEAIRFSLPYLENEYGLYADFMITGGFPKISDKFPYIHNSKDVIKELERIKDEVPKEIRIRLVAK